MCTRQPEQKNMVETTRQRVQSAEVAHHIGELFAKKKKPLDLLFKRACESFGYTYRHLEEATDVHQEILRRLLPGLSTKTSRRRRDNHADLAIPVIPYLSEHLGLDTYFTLKVGVRDLLERILTSSDDRVPGGKSARDRHAVFLRRLIRQLDQELRVLYPLKASHFRRVFAFTRERVLARVSQATLAAEIASHQIADADRSVRLFEAGRLTLDDAEGKALLESLSALTGRPLTWGILDDDARKQREVVRLDPSLEARAVSTLPRVQQVVGPRKPQEGTFEYSRTASPVPGLIVERFCAEYRGTDERLFRIIGAHHEGLEVAYVASGSVHVTFKRTPFPVESPGEPPTFTEGEDGVIHDEILGAGALIFFRSPNYHRVHFLEDTTLISVNLLHTIHLSGLTER